MILPLKKLTPSIDEDTFIAETAVIAGNVTLGKGSSVWYGAVMRGDYEAIEVGRGSNIQDQCVIHVVKGKPVKVGDQVTIGHSAVLHGCQIEDGCIIGMGAVILDGAVIGKGSLIGAGALVPEGKVIPPGSLALGSPAKVVREFKREDSERLKGNALGYEALWREMYTG